MSDIIPASPSTAGLTSDEALLIRDELRDAERRLLARIDTFRHEGVAGRKSIRDDVLDLKEGLETRLDDVAVRQHQLSDSILAVLRRVIVSEALRAEATRRAEAHAKMTDERLAFVVRRLERDHDVLADVKAKVPDEEILPWFRRAWRPALAFAAVLMVGSAITACATVSLMSSDGAVDSGRPAPTYIFPDRQP